MDDSDGFVAAVELAFDRELRVYEDDSGVVIELLYGDPQVPQDHTILGTIAIQTLPTKAAQSGRRSLCILAETYTGGRRTCSTHPEAAEAKGLASGDVPSEMLAAVGPMASE